MYAQLIKQAAEPEKYIAQGTGTSTCASAVAQARFAHDQPDLSANFALSLMRTGVAVMGTGDVVRADRSQLEADRTAGRTDRDPLDAAGCLFDREM